MWKHVKKSWDPSSLCFKKCNSFSPQKQMYIKHLTAYKKYNQTLDHSNPVEVWPFQGFGLLRRTRRPRSGHQWLQAMRLRGSRRCWALAHQLFADCCGTATNFWGPSNRYSGACQLSRQDHRACRMHTPEGMMSSEPPQLNNNPSRRE